MNSIVRFDVNKSTLNILYYQLFLYSKSVFLKVGAITPVGIMKPFSGGNESLSKSNSSLK